jgi:hypothetical protein
MLVLPLEVFQKLFDLKSHSEEINSYKTVEGLRLLRKRLGDEAIDFPYGDMNYFLNEDENCY